MSWLVRWLLTALLSAAAGALAHVFEGSCPLDAHSFVCGHWDAIVTVAVFVLGAFGVTVKRPKKDETATIKSGLRVVTFNPGPAVKVIPPSMPDAGGTEVPDAVLVTEKTEPDRGDKGG